MPKLPYTSYNLFFIIPYVIWIVTGGCLLLAYPDPYILFSLVNTHYNGILNNVMFYITWLGNGVIITLLLLIPFSMASFRNWWYFTAATLCNSLPALMEQWLKRLFDKPRPIYYFHNATWIHTESGWPILLVHSFPSGHTTGVFSLCCFVSLLLRPRYKWLGIPLLLVALTVAYSRLYLAAHFFLDVYVGSILGGTSSLLIYFIMKKYQHFFFRKDTMVTS